ncbi:AAA family ATPase [Sinorhizobium fredii]|uniref:AAA family ATPase n=1 Tax=Rhizobium fredii TaxID=380 RepID=UPI0004B87778|nr:AAA family ATPase [Sinorhizobium fredii]
MADIVKFPVMLRRYRTPDPKTIPLRPWVMRGLLLRKQITAIIAAGGLGKSILGLVIAWHLAAGKNYGPFRCNHGDRYRVAILTCEEDPMEFDRRMAAVKKHFGFTDDDEEYLHIVNIDEPPILAQADKNGHVCATKKLAEMEMLLGQYGIDVIIIDPFIEIWNGQENDNAQVKAAAAALRAVARRQDAACMLMHHVRKGGVTPGDIDASRGGSSFGGLVRLAFTLCNMTHESAMSFGIKSPKGIVRLDPAKSNYTPPAEDAHWFKFANVDLENGTDGDNNSDRVGVLFPWVAPGLFENIGFDTIEKVLDAIQTPQGIGHERYTFAAQAKERYVAHPIAELLEIDVGRAERIMKCWKKSGLLYEADYVGSKSRLKKGVFVDGSKRPSATAEV